MFRRWPEAGSRVSKPHMSLPGNKKFFGARGETFDFPQRGEELRAQLVRQVRLRLAQCQRLRQQAQLLAMPRIEPLPQAALALCVSPQPLLAGYFRPPAGWLQDRLLLLGFRRNHVRWGSNLFTRRKSRNSNYGKAKQQERSEEHTSELQSLAY